MSKDAPANVVGNTSKFPGLKNTAKKATTLFLTPTFMARVSRKLPGDNVSVSLVGLRSELIIGLNFEQVKKIRRLARKPYRPQDHDAIKECCNKFTEGKSSDLLKKILARRYSKSTSTLKDVQEKCGRQVSCESCDALLTYLI